MRLLTLQALSPLLALLLSSPCAGQSAPGKFDCDAPPGTYSQFDIPQTGPQYHVSGSVSAERYRSDGHWGATATIGLISSDQKAYAGIQLRQIARGDDVVLVIQTSANGKGADNIVRSYGKKEPVTFSIDGSEGRITILAAGKSFAAPDVGTGSLLRLSCSTGEFIFQDLTWQTTSNRQQESAQQDGIFFLKPRAARRGIPSPRARARRPARRSRAGRRRG